MQDSRQCAQQMLLGLGAHGNSSCERRGNRASLLSVFLQPSNGKSFVTLRLQIALLR